jgi:hypothetical protein
VITTDSLALAVPRASNVSVNGSVVAIAVTTGTGDLEGVCASAYPEDFSPPFLSCGSSHSPAAEKTVKIPMVVKIYLFRMVPHFMSDFVLVVGSSKSHKRPILDNIDAVARM